VYLAATISEIDKYLTNLRTTIKNFKENPPLIIFPAILSTPLTEKPPVLVSGLNNTFLAHQAEINRISDSLDRIQSGGLEKIQHKRRSAIKEALAHQDYLDSLVANAWRKFKQERATETVQLSGPPDLLIP
jgi:hypothetical protein